MTNTPLHDKNGKNIKGQNSNGKHDSVKNEDGTSRDKANPPEPTAEQRTKLPLSTGPVYITPEAGKLNPLEVFACLQRHTAGDWGELCRDDWQLNNEALVEDARVLSSYTARSGEKFWIITESDRSSTTVLLPSEY